MRNLTRTLSFSHISILKKYSLKSHNRFEQADRYIASNKWENVKDYATFHNNSEETDKIFVPVSQKDEDEIYSIMKYENPRFAWTMRPYFAYFREQDEELEYPIEGKTLLSFIKEGLKERKPHQTLFWKWVIFLTTAIVCYTFWWYGSEDDAYVSHIIVNPEVIENYNLKEIENPIKEQKRKIGVQLQELKEVIL